MQIFLVETIPLYVFDKKRRSTDPILNSYFIKLEKATRGGVL